MKFIQNIGFIVHTTQNKNDEHLKWTYVCMWY